MNWRDYEKQIFAAFEAKYGKHIQILGDQLLPGRISKVDRQVDLLIKYRVADIDCIGVFDCKCFNKCVDVTVIDGMVGFLDDVNAHLGGVVTTQGFSEGAMNRAKGARIDLRIVQYESPSQVVDQFVPKMDFSDPRNSMYMALIF